MPVYDAEKFGALCEQCTLSTRRAAGPVGPEERPNPNAVIITEFPRERDVETGRPLTDNLGGMEFNESLKAVGVARNTVTLTHAIACRPVDNDIDKEMLLWQRENKKREAAGEDPLPSPIQCCRPRLLNDIGQTPNLITLGKRSFQALTGSNAAILEIRGGPIEARFNAVGHFEFKPPEVGSTTTSLNYPIKLLPTLHPGFVVHVRRWTKAFRSDISRAFRWFNESLGWVEPEIILNPSYDDLAAFLQTNDMFVVDTETTFEDPTISRLKCIGFATENKAMVVHFYSIEDESKFYTQFDENRIRQLIKEFLVNPNILKVGHNYNYFDTLVLQHHFGVKPEPVIDTLVMHRLVESELPHGLGFIGSLYTDVTSWKAAHTAKEARTDSELGLYCLFHGTRVNLADGSSMSIEDIVRDRLPVEVVSRDSNGQRVSRRVVGWHRQLMVEQQWRQIHLASLPQAFRGIIATPEHEIHTTRGRVQAQDVVVGDRVFIDEQAFTSYERQALIGTLLGDSCLAVSPSYRQSPFEAHSAALSGGHVEESGLAQHKVSVMPHILTALPVRAGKMVDINGRKGQSRPFMPVASSMFHQLRELMPLFCDADGTRRLRIEALDQAGAVGLAWWFMDDGCRQKVENTAAQDSIVISTQRYPLEDVLAARDWLESRFGKIYVGADGILRFSATAAESFCRHVAEHIPEALRYKMPRGINFPAYKPSVSSGSNEFASAAVTRIGWYAPEVTAKYQEIRLRTRYCLTVEDTHNFMTSAGLVQNCAMDTVVNYRIINTLANSLKLKKQDHLLAKDMRVQDICRGMHEVGMWVDVPRRRELAIQTKQDIINYLAETQKSAGIPDFNPNSAGQIRKLLFETWGLSPVEYTKLGDPKTDDFTLRMLRAEHGHNLQIASFIFNIRKYKKAVKVYGTYIQRMVPYGHDVGNIELDDDDLDDEQDKEDPRGLIMSDGRIRPDYNSTGTKTGRLSSSNPNSQNFPKKLRSMIRAAPGHVLVGADADHLELRIITAVAQIKAYLDVFQDPNGDPHAMTASLMFGDSFKKLVRKSDQWTNLRKLGKGIAYASFYGSGDETVHSVVTSAEEDGKPVYPNLTVREVALMRRKWLGNIPEMKRSWDRTVDEYREQGYLVDPYWGRRRDFLDGEKFNELINFGIQSAGAHIIHDATFKLMDQIPFFKWGHGTGLINQCHDALVFEVPMDHEKYKGPDAEFKWCPPGCNCTANNDARMIKEAMNLEIKQLPGVRFSARPEIDMTWDKV